MIDVAEYNLETIKRILAKYAADCEVRAFGSRVNWTAKDYSDLDLAIIAQGKIDRRTMTLLREAFEESKLPFRVDVLDWHAISGEFRTLIANQYETIQPAKQKYPIDWKETTLDDLADFRNGKSLSNEFYTPYGKFPVFGANGQIAKTDQLLNNEPLVVIGRVGAYCGSVYCVNEPSWVTDNAIIASPKNGVDYRFLYYRLVSLDLRRTAIGSAQPLMTQGGLKVIKTIAPLLPEQKAISHILGTLDDKLELNRRMNKTLEEIAQAIFKSWFIDFDFPNEKGKPYKSTSGEMIDSELGKIPKGWKVDNLGNILELAYGKALKEEERKVGSIPVFGSNGQVGWHDEKLVEGPGIIVGRKGNPGIITWAYTDFFAIDTTFYVIPKKPELSSHFLFYALQDQNLPSIAADSAVPGLNRNLAYMSQQIVPSMEILQLFDKLVKRLYTKIHANEKQSRTLAALRDALLPKLLSGQIRVKI